MRTLILFLCIVLTSLSACLAPSPYEANYQQLPCIEKQLRALLKEESAKIRRDAPSVYEHDAFEGGYRVTDDPNVYWLGAWQVGFADAEITARYNERWNFDDHEEVERMVVKFKIKGDSISILTWDACTEYITIQGTPPTP